MRQILALAAVVVATTASAVVYKVQDDKGQVLLTNVLPEEVDGTVTIMTTQTIKSARTYYGGQPNNRSSGQQAFNNTNQAVSSYANNTNNINANTTAQQHLPDYRIKDNAPNNIRYELNRLENVNQRTLGSMGAKWHSNAPIVVAHFGDSHIQTGWQIAPIRNALQSLRGDGGRGMVFPYAIAKTYSQEDYKSRFTGNWKSANSIHQPPKIGVGVSGFVAKTSDSSASTTLSFKEPLGTTQAVVYYKADGDYRVSLDNGATTQTLTATPSSAVRQLVFDLPNGGKTLALQLQKNSPSGSFELHGISLNKNNTGLIYHNLGVGGANFKALLQQKHFADTFATLNADLTVLDWGTNDILYTNKIPDDFAKTVRATIARIRAINPTTAIVLKSVQEPRYKGKNVSVSADLSQILRQIAFEEGVLYYDWYAIAGGSNSTAVWHKAGFASKDNIHLNGKGYRIEGELFAYALVDALNQGN